MKEERIREQEEEHVSYITQRKLRQGGKSILPVQGKGPSSSLRFSLQGHEKKKVRRESGIGQFSSLRSDGWEGKKK